MWKGYNRKQRAYTVLGDSARLLALSFLAVAEAAERRSL